MRRTPSICDKNSCVSFDTVAFEPVAGLQQPAAQPGLDGMQRVAGGGLLNLDQQHLAIAHVLQTASLSSATLRKRDAAMREADPLT